MRYEVIVHRHAKPAGNEVGILSIVDSQSHASYYFPILLSEEDFLVYTSFIPKFEGECTYEEALKMFESHELPIYLNGFFKDANEYEVVFDHLYSSKKQYKVDEAKLSLEPLHLLLDELLRELILKQCINELQAKDIIQLAKLLSTEAAQYDDLIYLLKPGIDKIEFLPDEVLEASPVLNIFN